MLALGFVLSEQMRSFCVNHHWMTAVLAGIRLRSGVRALCYSKTLRLRTTAVSTGQAVTILSNDSNRLLEACNYVEFCVSTPITVLVAMGVMIWVIGVSALSGFAVLLLFSPLQAQIGSKLATLRRSTAKITDERVRVMSELLNGIRLLKFYGFEASFAEKIAGIREKEVGMLRSSAVVRVINTVAAFSIPVLVTLATFAANAAMGNNLEPQAAFVVVALFNVARFPLGVLPQSTRCLSEAIVAAKRIQAFLSLPEVRLEDDPIRLPASASSAAADGDDNAAQLAEIAAVLEVATRRACALLGVAAGEVVLPAASVAIEARGATYRWDAPPSSNPPQSSLKSPQTSDKTASADAAASKSASDNVADTPKPSEAAVTSIADLSFTLTQSSLVAVVGAVGSGKSSLLSALLGQMSREHGAIFVRGTVAYAAQTPWIFSGTLRENVLFGRPFDAQRYNASIHACALEPDLAILPGRDLAEIGERGLNLSGGQKARVALARALYADSDIYLLDDPLAAVDAHTGKHLWRYLIQQQLVKRGKTVIIVTHQLQYLPSCDAVMLMEGGKVAAYGSYQEVRQSGVDLRNAGHGSAQEGMAAMDDDDGEIADAAAAALSSGAAASLKDDASSASTPTLNPNGIATGGADSTASPLPESGGAIVVVMNNPMHAAAGAVAEGSAAAAKDGTATPVPASQSKASPPKPASQLVAEEDRAIGAVGAQTFAAYFRAAGGWYTIVLVFTVLIVGKGSKQVSDWFLSYWTQGGKMQGVPPIWGDGKQQLSHEDSLNYAWLYAVTVAGVLACNLAQGLIFAYVTLHASQSLHDRIFASVMRAKISWFDTQPTGRLLSRFTGDVDVVDNTLPASLETALDYIVTCVLSVVLIAAIFPWFLIAAMPLLFMFVFITRMFRRVARELKRLDNISRGPLVSHATATSQGLATIRAYGETQRFQAANFKHIDLNTKTYWSLYALNRWVAIRVDVVTTLTAGVTALLCVMSRDWLSPALAGLSISYALSLAGILQYCMRLTTETEANFTSVERLNYYASNIPHEVDAIQGAISEREAEAIVTAHGAQLLAEGDRSSTHRSDELMKGKDNSAAAVSTSALCCCTGGRASGGRGAAGSSASYPGWYPAAWNQTLRTHGWPFNGRIDFSGVSVRYRDGLPLVLDNINFKVQAGHSIGIVGRTGSGKTTLSLTLFRVLELASGAISIDGIDISRVSVHQLRRGLAIIPQDPTLFRGTIRSNLDLFSENSDDACWTALEHSGLKGFVQSLPGQLLADVQEGGANLSVGQRQLICLARALLRGAKVVVMDEATASLDASSDAQIQSTLRTSMRSCTLLVIAHRLRTIMECDRILALKDGTIAEYDAPAALLGLAPPLETMAGKESAAAAAGVLRGLVEETGPTTAADLRALAVEGYRGTTTKI